MIVSLDEFLATPARQPTNLLSDFGGYTNEDVIVAVVGTRGISAVDPVAYEVVAEKYGRSIVTFKDAFKACKRGSHWHQFDIEALHACNESFEALELPEGVLDNIRTFEDQLVQRKSALFTSHNPSWCTPKEVLDPIRQFAPIALDPCSNASSIVHASVEWNGSAGEDGLQEQWSVSQNGIVFVNPPYGRCIGSWANKMSVESRRGVEIIALVPARVDTKWWQENIAYQASATCFWKGRIRFLGTEAGAPFSSAVTYFGSRADDFISIFKHYGWCVRHV